MQQVGRVYPVAGMSFCPLAESRSTITGGIHFDAPHRRLNHECLAALRRGETFVGERRCGKTVTLLTFIAVTFPEIVRHGTHSPIVVCETLAGCHMLRDYYRKMFPEAPEPRWMSKRQNFEGLTGVLFAHECDVSHLPFFVRGGGVTSQTRLTA